MILHIFNNLIYVHNNIKLTAFEPFRSRFNNGVENLIIQHDLKKNIDTSQIGNALSTVTVPYALFTIPGYKELIEDITPFVGIALDKLNYKSSNYSINRSWVNIMFEGCIGKSHIHDNKGPVFIFYLECPDDSGSFVVINSQTIGCTDSEFLEKDKYSIKPFQNMLIGHGEYINHTITKHNSKQRRMCLVIELVDV